MKKKLLFGTLPVILTLLLTACGIPQYQYDELASERDAAQAEVLSVQNELEKVEESLSTTESELSKVESDLSMAESTIENLENELSSTNDQLSNANSRLSSVNSELSAMNEVYPPRDFSSLSELRNWLVGNGVSEREQSTFAESWYMNALDLQNNALNDGFIVSVDIDYDYTSDAYTISCATVINGDIWVWDPENDEPYNYSEAIDFQSVR